MDKDDFRRASYAHLSGNGNKGEETIMNKIDRDATKARKVEDLLSLHNDEQTTKLVNRKWREMRDAVDGRANLDDAHVTGELTIKVKYKALGDSGKKEITIIADHSLPKDKPNTQILFEGEDGVLQTANPKQTKLDFDNVTPIRKNV